MSSARRHTFFLFLCLLPFTAISQEFLYPVAVCNRTGLVCVIYQKTPTHIELWLWDKETKHMQQGLLSRFTPAGLTLLPDGRSFSFINNGALMVKQFMKRSPGTFEFTQPLYDISLPNWLDEQTCYLSAKKRTHHGLFQVDRCGEVSPICWDDLHDYLYPQKVGGELFCIERTTDRGSMSHALIKIPYPKICDVMNMSCISSWTMSDGNSLNDNEDLVRAANRSAAIDRVEVVGSLPTVSFLSMVSDKSGYYISHPSKVGQKSASIEFTYWKFVVEEGVFETKPLFSFVLPIDLLLFNRDTRLYESVLPLLPQRYGQKIFFMHVTEGECGCNLNLFCYDEEVGTTKQLTNVTTEGMHYFRPLQVGNAVILGGSLRDSEDADVRMWIDSDGEIRAQFLVFPLD